MLIDEREELLDCELQLELEDALLLLLDDAELTDELLLLLLDALETELELDWLDSELLDPELETLELCELTELLD